MLMKTFIYCATTDGGMEDFKIKSSKELIVLYGWMNKICRHDDNLLIEWMEVAEVGDYFEHRLGLIFRVKDEEE